MLFKSQQSITAIIQARMNSTRLPGKVLLEVCGKPLIQHQLERISRCDEIDRIIVATTTNRSDDKIADLCSVLGYGCHRGSEADVLERFSEAASLAPSKTVIRLTADCPLIDPHVVSDLIQFYELSDPHFDYASNTRHYPRGLDAEIFSSEALFTAAEEAKLPFEREHVTPYLYRRPEKFRCGSLDLPIDLRKNRWTVDTAEDFTLVKLILEALLPTKQNFLMNDVLELVRLNPEWIKINQSVVQKSIEG